MVMWSRCVWWRLTIPSACSHAFSSVCAKAVMTCRRTGFWRATRATLINLSKALGLATLAYLYESRELNNGGPHMVAMCQGKKVTAFVESLPQWAQKVLGGRAPG